MSTLMTFQSGSDILNFEAGATYPADRPVEMFQVQDRTASGGIQVESLGVMARKRALTFDLMSQTDYDNLLFWFTDIAVGGKNDFTFTDERGFTGQVKITDSKFGFRETYFELYAGTLNLEYV